MTNPERLKAASFFHHSSQPKLGPGDPFRQAFAQELNKLPQSRLAHVYKALQNYHALMQHRYKHLYFQLDRQEAAESTFDRYKAKLSEINDINYHLPYPMQIETHAAIVLHDIGYPKNPGWKHNVEGGKLAPQIIRDAGVRLNPERIGIVIGKHGLTNNFGVDVFPEDILKLPIDVRRQIFILDCMDCTAKAAEIDGVKKFKSKLGERLITQMQEILTREDFIQDSEWFLEYRLRHLLAPSTFVRLDDKQLNELKLAMGKILSEREYKILTHLLLKQLENGAFPVFQELFLNHEGVEETVMLLKELALKLSESGMLNHQRIFFRTEPDIFGLDKAGPERPRLIEKLKGKLAQGTFNRNSDLKTVATDKKKEIVLAL